jgi:hypothetical protein
MVLVPGLAQAQDASQMAPPFVVDVGAGETVEIPVLGFCLNYSLPFPGDTLSAGDLAVDGVRKSIAYATEQGYVESDPWQTQLAVWYFTEDSQKVNEEHGAVADEIIEFGESDAPLPEEGATATPLPQAIADGVVSASVEGFTDVSPAGFTFLGEGKLVVTNLTEEVVSLLIPYGTVFHDTANEGVQSMGIFPKPGTEPPAAPEAVTEPPAQSEVVVEPPIVPETGAFLAPELLAALGVLGLGGGAFAVRRARRPR